MTTYRRLLLLWKKRCCQYSRIGSTNTKSNGKITVENNATIYLKYGKFNKLSKNVYTFEINNIDKQGPEIGEIETSCTDSSIAVTITAIDMGNPKLKYYFKLADDEKFVCT